MPSTHSMYSASSMLNRTLTGCGPASGAPPALDGATLRGPASAPSPCGRPRIAATSSAVCRPPSTAPKPAWSRSSAASAPTLSQKPPPCSSAIRPTSRRLAKSWGRGEMLAPRRFRLGCRWMPPQPRFLSGQRALLLATPVIPAASLVRPDNACALRSVPCCSVSMRLHCPIRNGRPDTSQTSGRLEVAAVLRLSTSPLT
mmetsp:Transcript_36998/g.94585  ORF Transcript_36998/g.94585 Transcript_36998/m.94585 type:complete len:200 (+) Transcript_36998:588-1187(+)